MSLGGSGSRFAYAKIAITQTRAINGHDRRNTGNTRRPTSRT